jgi:hypothetical protein
MEARIGVYVCHCGTNISGKVNISEVTEFATDLPCVGVHSSLPERMPCLRIRAWKFGRAMPTS